MTSSTRETKGREKMPANRCRGITAKGERCKRKALKGQQYCAVHLKDTTGDAEKALPPPVRLKDEFPRGLKDVYDMLARRMRGEYNIDDWGWDEELLDLVYPLGKFFYHKYWRVKATGLENVPARGRALLVANHSGVLPFDGAMVLMSILEEHPEPRLVRALVLSLFFELPFTTPMLSKFGQVQASPANSERLLNQDQLALVFPEGVKGIGKPFAKRYQLARFGRGGFVRVALNTKSPIIPVSIVGAEEIYPMIGNLKPLASLLGFPYVPVTPTFPFLGPLGFFPLPTKWYIHFDKPIHIDKMDYRRSEEPLLVTKISNQVRDTIQKNIHERLKTRRNMFFG